VIFDGVVCEINEWRVLFRLDTGKRSKSLPEEQQVVGLGQWRERFRELATQGGIAGEE
jgi:hypothetical protein